MPESTCLCCGRTLISKTCPRRYCDAVCRRAAPGVADRDRANNRQSRRRNYVPIQHAGTCVVCGSAFVSKRPNRIYCKPACAQFASYVSVLERGVRDDPAVRTNRKAWMAENRHRYLDKEREAQRRRHAANPQLQRDKDRRRRLRGADARLRRHKHRQAQLKLGRAARGTHGGQVVWASGPCRRCGKQFVGKQNYSGQVPCYCSKRCGAADTRDRRRAGSVRYAVIQ